MYTTSEVGKIVDEIKNGRFFHLEMETEPKMLAEFVKQGYKVVKHTKLNAQIGCKYETLKAKYNPNGTASNKKSYTEFLIPRKLTYNSNTKKYCVVYKPIFDANNVSEYKVFKNGVEVNETWQDKIVSSNYVNPIPYRSVEIKNIIDIH